MKKLFSTMLIALLCAGVALAQERVQRVITIKNGNLGAIVRTMKDLLPGTSVLVTSDNEHLILSGPKDTVAGFEEIIKQLDVPPPVKKNVETTVYMIAASSEAGNAAPMPPELDPVVKQLKGIFSYKGFHLLDSFVLRSRDGEKGDTSGYIPALPGGNVLPNTIHYYLKYNRVTVNGGDAGGLIRFDGLSFALRTPNASEAGISTDVDVPVGKKVVVGKTSTLEGSDSALFLVISAKVVD